MTRKDLLKLAVLNLMRRKSRTFLTMLGVVIGCCSIVIMISLGIGMKKAQEKTLAEMGDLTIITVTAPKGKNGGKKLNDAAIRLLQEVRDVNHVMPRVSLDDFGFTVRLYAGTGNRYVCDWTSVAGLKSDEMNQMGYRLLSGTEIKKPGDILTGQYFAYNFADSLKPAGSNTVDRYGGETESGKTERKLPPPFFNPEKTAVTLEVTNGDIKYTRQLNPVGRVAEDNAKGYETSEGFMMRMDDMRELLKKAGISREISYGSALVKVQDIRAVSSAEEAIRTLGFQTSSMDSIRKPMEKEARQKQLMLGGLGAISLFVAALGIMNTMIMSISERTKEIGIMKALGCLIGDIRFIFLTEAALIGMAGGIAGCLVSGVISVLINLISAGTGPAGLITVLSGAKDYMAVSVIPLWLPASAVLFSLAIGLGSGFYPAEKAVRIPALEAIREHF